MTWRRGSTSVVLALSTLLPGASAPGQSELHDARAYPHFALIRGGGLDSTVLLRHANVRVTGRVADVRESPLVIVYSSLSWVHQPDTSVLAQQRYYEVAEFYGPAYMGWADASGSPNRPLDWEDANRFSRIHPDAPGGALWYRPGSQPRNSSAPFAGIPEEAARVLASIGLRLTPVPRRS